MIRRISGVPHGIALAALVALLVGLLAATPVASRNYADDGAGTVAGVDAGTLFAHPHVMGASASFGFGVRAPFPAEHPGRLQHVSLARIAESARDKAGTVTSDATTLFFTSPIEIGKGQVDRALAAKPKPSVVLAVDYLFWFTYGARDAERAPIRDEAQRLKMLEVGLANLDRLTAAGIPVIVGDFPDMSDAVGKMLSAAQMPKAETLTAANARLAEWAAKHPMVAVVPLAQLVRQLDAGEPFKAGERTWSSKTDGALIQSDRLHPTFAGTVALLARAEQTAREHFGCPTPDAHAFEHDPNKVAEKVRAFVEAELAARAAAREKAGSDASKSAKPEAPR